MASGLKFYQTWQAEEELYFSHIEAKLEGFSGTTMIQRRKQVDATNGFIKFLLLFFTDVRLSFLKLLTPVMEFRLGFK